MIFLFFVIVCVFGAPDYTDLGGEIISEDSHLQHELSDHYNHDEGGDVPHKGSDKDPLPTNYAHAEKDGKDVLVDLYARKNLKDDELVGYGEREILTNEIDTGSSYKEKPIYDLKAHQDSSHEVKLLLKNYQSMQDVLNEQKREEVEVLKKSVLLNKIQKVAGVLEQKDGGKLSSGHETKALETKTEDSRTSNPKFQVNNAAEEVHESLKIEVPNSDVEIVVNIDEEAENAKPQGENHQGEDEIIEEEEESRDGRIVNKNGQRRNTIGGATRISSRPSSNPFDSGYRSPGGPLHQNVHTQHVHDYRDQSVSYSNIYENSPASASEKLTCTDSLDCAKQTQSVPSGDSKQDTKIEISVNINDPPVKAEPEKDTQDESMLGWIGNIFG